MLPAQVAGVYTFGQCAAGDASFQVGWVGAVSSASYQLLQRRCCISSNGSPAVSVCRIISGGSADDRQEDVERRHRLLSRMQEKLEEAYPGRLVHFQHPGDVCSRWCPPGGYAQASGDGCVSLPAGQCMLAAQVMQTISGTQGADLCAHLLMLDCAHSLMLDCPPCLRTHLHGSL